MANSAHRYNGTGMHIERIYDNGERDNLEDRNIDYRKIEENAIKIMKDIVENSKFEKNITQTGRKNTKEVNKRKNEENIKQKENNIKFKTIKIKLNSKFEEKFHKTIKSIGYNDRDICLIVNELLRIDNINNENTDSIISKKIEYIAKNPKISNFNRGCVYLNQFGSCRIFHKKCNRKYKCNKRRTHSLT